LAPPLRGVDGLSRAAGRIASTCIVLLTAATLVGGCGSSDASANESSTEQAELRAFAGEVNLRASDAPGFKVVLAGEGEQEGRPGPLPHGVETCDGGPVANEASRGRASALFQTKRLPIQTVLSAVYSSPSPSTASAYIAAADGGRGLDCLQRYEVERSRRYLRVPDRIEVVSLRPPLAGTPISGVRVWTCLSGAQPCESRRVRSFTDRLWFAAGGYVVTLVYIAGPRNLAKSGAPIALSVERRIIALQYGRAQAQKT